MRKSLLIATMILLAATTLFAKGLELTKPAGAHTVVFSLEKNPPAVGNNAATVVVKDAAGKAVTDAKVVVDYGMSAMPGMPAMNYSAPLALKGTSYTGSLNFSMGGAWNVAVKVTKAGKTDTAKYNIDIH